MVCGSGYLVSTRQIALMPVCDRQASSLGLLKATEGSDNVDWFHYHFTVIPDQAAFQ